MTFRGDTIAAIATAPGRGGVAIVRVSGLDAFKIAETLTGKPPTPGQIAIRKIFGIGSAEDNVLSKRLRDENIGPHIIICGPDGAGKTYSPHEDKPSNPAARFADSSSPHVLIDECVLLAFEHPHSYTGEDVVEVQCHGGTVTPRRVLEACFAAGARLAERGEFTARAFFNGRMPLDAAEGVIELVDAKTDRAADAALAQLGGERGKRNRALYETALDISTSLEHTLDIDEGELPEGYVPNLTSRVQELRKEISSAIAHLREGKILRDGARVVLAGPPNAGKSSLLNALLGENRAIVSATPGTTRDSIEEWLDVEGWPVRLTDTAGLRGTSDEIEAEGVARANDLIAKADLVIALDCDIPGSIRIHAKCDLDKKVKVKGEGEKVGVNSWSSRKECLTVHSRTPTQNFNSSSSVQPSISNLHLALPVSVKTGEGLDKLRHAIAAALEKKAQQVDEPAGDDEREAALLTEALAAVQPSTSNLQPDIVLLANAVRTCAETLGRLVGAVYSDDLLDAIFSRFCVGK